MINNVYKTQIAPQKLDRSLCIPGTFCISIYKDRLVKNMPEIFEPLGETTKKVRKSAQRKFRI